MPPRNLAERVKVENSLPKNQNCARLPSFKIVLPYLSFPSLLLPAIHPFPPFCFLEACE